MYRRIYIMENIQIKDKCIDGYIKEDIQIKDECIYGYIKENIQIRLKMNV